MEVQVLREEGNGSLVYEGSGVRLDGNFTFGNM